MPDGGVKENTVLTFRHGLHEEHIEYSVQSVPEIYHCGLPGPPPPGNPPPLEPMVVTMLLVVKVAACVPPVQVAFGK